MCLAVIASFDSGPTLCGRSKWIFFKLCRLAHYQFLKNDSTTKSGTLSLPNDFELLHSFAIVCFADVHISFGVDGDAVRVRELTYEMSGSAAKGGKNFAGIAVEHIDLFVIFINDIQPFLSCISRKRQHGR